MATNVERIEAELRKASEELEDKYDGYGQALIAAALECIVDEAEHAETRTNINQVFKKRLKDLAEKLAEQGG